MIDLASLYRENRLTYYVIHEDGTKSNVDLKPRYFWIFVGALVMSIIPSAINKDMVAGVITAQSILMGFAFNVMVYIASQDALKVDANGYREDKGKFARLNQLADEIFYNLSYYIAVSLISVILCVWWLVVSSSDLIVVEGRSLANDIGMPWIEGVPSFFYGLVRFTLLAFAIESVLTFSRLVRRVTFHFRERRKAQARAKS